MNQTPIRILLPIFIAIAGWLFWQHQERIFGDKGRLTVSQEESAVVLAWNAEVEVPMVVRFDEAFSQWRNKTTRFIVDLNSPGGSLLEGSQLIDLLEEIKRTHRLETRVGDRRYCLSMCVPIFLTGDNRIAAANSQWMFHEPLAVDFFTDEISEIPEFEKRRTAERFFNRYFVDSGMDPAWRENLRQEWVGKEVWRTGQQLVNEGSNIILELN